MVSIESRNGFLAQLASDPDARTMVALVCGDDSKELAAGRRSADRIAVAILKSDKSEFEKIIAELEERKLSPTAEWIKDDYLLFSLVVGSLKFKTGAVSYTHLTLPTTPYV